MQVFIAFQQHATRIDIEPVCSKIQAVKATTADNLTHYLHTTIPLAKQMHSRVARYDGQTLEMAAPLHANSNPHGTGFAGSQSTLAMLTSWALIYGRLHDAGLEATVVIKKSAFNFVQPVKGDLWTRAVLDDACWAPLDCALRAQQKVHLDLACAVGSFNQTCGHHQGTFVATPETILPVKV